MINGQEYIDNLSNELNQSSEFTKDDVFKEFEKYVADKERLRHAIDYGIFHYDYVHYCTSIKDTLFEDGMELILKICRNAFEVDSERASSAIKTGYAQVSNGLASYTQYVMLHPPIHEIDRFDLIVKEAFQIIGERTENSLKHFVLFISEMCRIIQNKQSVQTKFGVALDILMTYSETFSGIYKGLLLDISASQWRNISDHNNYEIGNDVVEVEYGSSERKKRRISKDDLMTLLKTLDVLLYMHKTAFTLLSIDYMEHFDLSLSAESKNQNTKQDNFISQLVETSFAFKCELKSIDLKSSPIKIEVDSKNTLFYKDDLTKYLSAVASFVGKDYCMLIYRKGKVEYQANYTNRKLLIFRKLQ